MRRTYIRTGGTKSGDAGMAAFSQYIGQKTGRNDYTSLILRSLLQEKLAEQRLAGQKQIQEMIDKRVKELASEQRKHQIGIQNIITERQKDMKLLAQGVANENQIKVDLANPNVAELFKESVNFYNQTNPGLDWEYALPEEKIATIEALRQFNQTRPLKESQKYKDEDWSVLFRIIELENDNKYLFRGERPVGINRSLVLQKLEPLKELLLTEPAHTEPNFIQNFIRSIGSILKGSGGATRKALFNIQQEGQK